MSADVLLFTEYVLADVWDERKRQLAKWGEQHHPDIYVSPSFASVGGTAESRRRLFAVKAQQWKDHNRESAEDWTGILLEEVCEALAEGDPAMLRAGLIQVAAVAVAWVEDLDSREA